VLSERLSESSKFVALLNFISEKVCSTNKLMHFINRTPNSFTAEVKVLFKVCLWVKILLSIIASSTSQCSAQNLAHLGSKTTNYRLDSFPSGHDQRSRCQIFSNVHCLPASMLLVVYKKTLLSFVFN